MRAAGSAHDTVHEAVENNGQVNIAVGGDVGVHPVSGAGGKKGWVGGGGGGGINEVNGVVVVVVQE